MQDDELLVIVQQTLGAKKALNIKSINVQNKTSITDFIVIATGTSQRHLKSMAEYIIAGASKQNVSFLSVKSEDGPGWVLIDLGNIVIHLMTASTREFYQLEQLWEQEFTVAEPT